MENRLFTKLNLVYDKDEDRRKKKRIKEE